MPRGIFDWNTPYKGLMFHAAEGEGGGGSGSSGEGEGEGNNGEGEGGGGEQNDDITMSPRRFKERLEQAERSGVTKLNLPEGYKDKIAFAEAHADKAAEEEAKLAEERGDFEKLKETMTSDHEKTVNQLKSEAATAKEETLRYMVKTELSSALDMVNVISKGKGVALNTLLQDNKFKVIDGEIAVVDVEGKQIYENGKNRSVEDIVDKFVEDNDYLVSKSSGSGTPSKTYTQRQGKRDFRAEIAAEKNPIKKQQLIREMNADLSR